MSPQPVYSPSAACPNRAESMIRDPGRHAAHTDAPALARRCGDALRVGQTSAAEQVVDDAGGPDSVPDAGAPQVVA